MEYASDLITESLIATTRTLGPLLPPVVTNDGTILFDSSSRSNVAAVTDAAAAVTIDRDRAMMLIIEMLNRTPLTSDKEVNDVGDASSQPNLEKLKSFQRTAETRDLTLTVNDITEDTIDLYGAIATIDDEATTANRRDATRRYDSRIHPIVEWVARYQRRRQTTKE